MVRQRILVFILVFLMAIAYALPPVTAFGSNKDTSKDYVGPGKHETILYVEIEGAKGKPELPEETSEASESKGKEGKPELPKETPEVSESEGKKGKPELPDQASDAAKGKLDELKEKDILPEDKDEELVQEQKTDKEKAKEWVEAGKVSMWNTKEEFIVSVEPTIDWQIAEVRVFVGTDPIPVTNKGIPQLGLFPYKEHFSEPVDSYELALNLNDDLDFTWGRRKAGGHIQNVSVYVQLAGRGEKGNGKQVIHEEAWAYGEKEFAQRAGWWTRYALEKPRTGHFIDSPVGGVTFNTGSQKGKTNSSGAFYYIQGEWVSLDLGSLHLGRAYAKHKVTLLDVAGVDTIYDTRVMNMARLLQSLDVDCDPQRGISITDPIIQCLDAAVQDLGIINLDFSDSYAVFDLIATTVSYCSDLGIELNIVSEEEALANLEKGMESSVFRKNISKTPEMETAKAKLELMPVYVPARRANGDPVTLVYKDADGELVSEREEAKPLVSVYADEIPGTNGAMDVFGAISRDEGNTWKRTNLSRSADKSSFTLANGYAYPGDVLKPNIKVWGNKILVVWTSRYARSGRPTYSIKIDDEGEEDYYPHDDEYYEEDIWGVSGPQRSTDYAELGFPEVGELPYHCVWTCRGVISEEDGEITWFKPERLTSGRRDAYQIMVNGANNAGFALVWQEDPKGVRPGEMAGPGHGWSGATTNHKTDVWYSYIKWDDYDKIDTNFLSGGDPQHDDDKGDGRPKALVPFKLPVRISDNDTLNTDSMKIDNTQLVHVQGPDDLGEVDENDESPFYVYYLSDTADEASADQLSAFSCDGGGTGGGNSSGSSGTGQQKGKDDSSGSHDYGLALGEDLLVRNEGGEDYILFHKKVNNAGATKYVAITADDRLLDGDTGASRPNVMMQTYQKTDGTYSAWAMIVYEETKGVGSGPPGDCGSGKEEVTILSGDQDGSGDGSHKGLDEYDPDKGKNVIYHSFDMADPDLVSAGTILNPQAMDEEGNLLYLEEEDGTRILDWNGDLIPTYENARRPRLIVQSKKNATDAVGAGEEATVMVTVYKMGEEGKGRPSDIFMSRWVVVKSAGHPSNSGNPYRPENLKKADKSVIDEGEEEVRALVECQNISSVTPTLYWENPDSTSAQDPDKDPIKVVRWEQTEENLNDRSWLNPYDDARAHRGFIKGNFLAIAYDWTPNWAAARNGNDVFNLYIRRSFDGGATWTTDPHGEGVTHSDTFKIYPDAYAPPEDDAAALSSEDSGSKEKETITTTYDPGDFEPARNMSQLTNTKETVIEPRLVGVPGTTLTGGVAKYPEDKQDTSAFWITYGTHSNPGRHSEEEGVPLDLYYSYSTDFGETYYDIEKEIKGENSNNKGDVVEVWDWLAKDTGKKEAEQAECQIRMTPDGSVFYAVWNETGEEGSDVMFRRIMRDGGSIEVKEEEPPADTEGPEITITGVNDGDTVNEDVSIGIYLDEEGTWTAYLQNDNAESVEFGEGALPYVIQVENEKREYVLRVEAEDIVGNHSYKQIAFTLDKSAVEDEEEDEDEDDDGKGKDDEGGGPPSSNPGKGKDDEGESPPSSNPGKGKDDEGGSPPFPDDEKGKKDEPKPGKDDLVANLVNKGSDVSRMKRYKKELLIAGL